MPVQDVELNAEGYTPLMSAVLLGNVAQVGALARAADHSIRSSSKAHGKMRALDMAARKGGPVLEACLRSANDGHPQTIMWGSLLPSAVKSEIEGTLAVVLEDFERHVKIWGMGQDAWSDAIKFCLVECLVKDSKDDFNALVDWRKRQTKIDAEDGLFEFAWRSANAGALWALEALLARGVKATRGMGAGLLVAALGDAECAKACLGILSSESEKVRRDELERAMDTMMHDGVLNALSEVIQAGGVLSIERLKMACGRMSAEQVNKVLSHAQKDMERIWAVAGFEQSCESGNLEVAKALVEKYGIKASEARRGVLASAVCSIDFRGRSEMSQWLMDWGADINEQIDGLSPLICAVAYAEKLCVEELLKRGVDVNAKGREGTTALMAAVISASNEAVELLVAHGADLKMCDDKGRTALIWGAYKQNPKGVGKLLVSCGVDELNAKDASGRTAYECAQAGLQGDRRDEVCALLEARRAELEKNVLESSAKCAGLVASKKGVRV